METIKSKTASYWAWFLANRNSIEQLILDKCQQDAFGLIKHELFSIHSGFGIELGRNQEGKFELTISPQGNHVLKYVTRYIRETMPGELTSAWIVHQHKVPAENPDDISIRIDNVDYTGKDLFFYPSVNKKDKRIDIEVYCDGFDKLDENQRIEIVFLMLEIYLGEPLVETVLGQIKTLTLRKKKLFSVVDGISFSQLNKYVHTCIKESEWTECDDLSETYTGYQGPKQPVKKLRDDIIFGITSCMRLFSGQGPEICSELTATGGEFGFLFFSNDSIDPDIKVVLKKRQDLGELIHEKMMEQSLGYIIGGATGGIACYIDVITFDKSAFLQFIEAFNKDFGIKLKYEPL